MRLVKKHLELIPCGTLATARRRSHIDGVVTISHFSADALAAIEATLPEESHG
jgi:hypothetical protein